MSVQSRLPPIVRTPSVPHMNRLVLTSLPPISTGKGDIDEEGNIGRLHPYVSGSQAVSNPILW